MKNRFKFETFLKGHGSNNIKWIIMNDFRIENVLCMGLYDGKRGLDKRKEG
jgi:hypothetical protein